VEGFYVSGAYAFTDAVSLRLTYARGTRINHDLGTAGIIGTLGTTPVDNTQLFFADLNVKF
jgi:hypothetical protein